MITVLLLSADPKENYRLNLDQEVRRIVNMRESSRYQEQFQIQTCPATTYDDLRRALLTYKPSIIHFCGHGMGEQGLVFVNDQGEKEIVDTEILVDLFKICQEENKNISCVIFNACHAVFQAEKISKYVKYTIGMSQEIKDNHAIHFAEVFSQALFLKTKIETAFGLGCNSIYYLIKKINTNTSYRAFYDPALNDEIASPSIFYYDIPQLIVNEDLEDINNLDGGLSRQKRIISYQQWNDLQLILLEIDFEILKNVCRDTLRQDVQDIEPKVLGLENLMDLKELLLEKYPTHKTDDTTTILDFANRLTIETDISNFKKLEVKRWLEKIAKPKNIQLQILEEVSPSERTLNSHLMISIIENTKISDSFSLEAELIFHYQEGGKYEPTTITSEQEGINEICPEEIESYISKLIYIAINKLPAGHNLTIELFVPFDYLGETFDLCKVQTASRNRDTLEHLGSKYQFIVRCLDRYEDKELFNYHINGWRRMEEFLSLNNPIIDEKCDYLKSISIYQKQKWNDLVAKWRNNKFYAINIIDELPVNEQKGKYFDYFLMSGVPISLWSRCSEVKCDRDDNDCTVEKKFKEILKIESFKDLSKIFEKIRILREGAHNADEKAKDYLGYHLGFICDHPGRIPSNLLKRLNKEGLEGSN